MAADTTLTDFLAERAGWQLLKQDKRISVYKIPLRDSGEFAIAKEFDLPGISKRLGFFNKCNRIRAFYRAIDSTQVVIPQLLASGVTKEDSPKGWLVYSFISGLDLRQVRWDMFPPAAIESIGREIGAALCQIHKTGWVHGDFKFANVMLNRSAGNNASVAVIDFDGVRKTGWLTRARTQRDLARFLLNGLESGAPTVLLSSLWKTYTENLGIKRQRAVAKRTRRWLQRLGGRHERQGRAAVDITPLAFL